MTAPAPFPQAGGFARLLTAPFAKPPGRLGTLRRLTPWLCLALAYASLAALFWQSDRLVPFLKEFVWEDYPSHHVAHAAHLAFRILTMLTLPFCAALAFSEERGAGTMEALVLTTASRRRVLKGRAFHVLLPWVACVLLVLPIYVMVLLPLKDRPFPDWGSTWHVLLPRSLMYYRVGPTSYHGPIAPAPRIYFILLNWGRLPDDLLTVFWLGTAGVYASVRFRSPTRRTIATYLLGPVLLLTFLSLDIYLLSRVYYRAVDSSFWAWVLNGCVLGSWLFRLLVPFWLMRRTAAGFDRFVLREP